MRRASGTCTLHLVMGRMSVTQSMSCRLPMSRRIKYSRTCGMAIKAAMPPTPNASMAVSNRLCHGC